MQFAFCTSHACSTKNVIIKQENLEVCRSNQNTNTQMPPIMTNKSDRNEHAPNPKRTLSALLSPRKFQSEGLANISRALALPRSRNHPGRPGSALDANATRNCNEHMHGAYRPALGRCAAPRATGHTSLPTALRSSELVNPRGDFARLAPLLHSLFCSLPARDRSYLLPPLNSPPKAFGLPTSDLTPNLSRRPSSFPARRDARAGRGNGGGTAMATPRARFLACIAVAAVALLAPACGVAGHSRGLRPGPGGAAAAPPLPVNATRAEMIERQFMECPDGGRARGSRVI